MVYVCTCRSDQDRLNGGGLPEADMSLSVFVRAPTASSSENRSDWFQMGAECRFDEHLAGRSHIPMSPLTASSPEKSLA